MRVQQEIDEQRMRQKALQERKQKMKVAKEREEELRQKMNQQAAAPKCSFTLKIEAPPLPKE